MELFTIKTEKIYDKVYYLIIRPDGEKFGELGNQPDALRLVSMLNKNYLETGKMYFGN